MSLLGIKRKCCNLGELGLMRRDRENKRQLVLGKIGALKRELAVRLGEI